MILVDTSVWAEHIDRRIGQLTALLEVEQILIHPFVVGELAMGNLRQRIAILGDLQKLPRSRIVTDGEVLRLVDQHRLFGRGIGYVDAHLLTAARLSADASLWTFDKKLAAAALQLGVAWVG